MILRVYSVRDVVAEAYLPPFCMQTNGQALRTFSDLTGDPEHQFGKHAGDYTLFELGEFDDNTGFFKMLDNPHCLGLGTEYVKPD